MKNFVRNTMQPSKEELRVRNEMVAQMAIERKLVKPLTGALKDEATLEGALQQIIYRLSSDTRSYDREISACMDTLRRRGPGRYFVLAKENAVWVSFPADVITPDTDAFSVWMYYKFSNDVNAYLVQVDSISAEEIKGNIMSRQQAAISNFLGMNEQGINDKVNDVLQGNLREIVSDMTVDQILTNRKQMALSVIENARPDLAKMGLEVVTFNVQDIRDAIDAQGHNHGVIEAIGIEQEELVKKQAEIARAQAARDVACAKADAEMAANAKEVEAQTAIAQRNNELQLAKAKLKAYAFSWQWSGSCCRWYTPCQRCPGCERCCSDRRFLCSGECCPCIRCGCRDLQRRVCQR